MFDPMFDPICFYFLIFVYSNKATKMGSVSIILRTNKVNKKGECPIVFRIIKDRKATMISSGYSVDPLHWDDVNKKIKASAKNRDSKETVARINAQITKRFGEIQNELIDIDGQNRRVSRIQIKEQLHGKNYHDFYEFAQKVIDSYKAENKIGTYSRTKTIITKMKEYAPSLTFHDVSPKFLANYEHYLKTKENPNSINTIHANIKFIRVIFNRAYREELIEYDLNPFLKYQLKTEKTQRVYLTEDELEEFINSKTTIGTKMDLHKDMFIFASYTGGLRVSDMLQLQWKHFNGEHIDFTIKKTRNQLSIKVPNKALAIIEKYIPTNENPNSFIFPMLPEGVLNLSATEIDNAISSATAYINKNLKLIAKAAKIEKNISFHTSRHTWATRALRKGVSIDKVSKLMGHSAIKETQVYAKIVNSELDKAMDVFND
jgi:integrase